MACATSVKDGAAIRFLRNGGDQGPGRIGAPRVRDAGAGDADHELAEFGAGYIQEAILFLQPVTQTASAGSLLDSGLMPAKQVNGNALSG